MVDLHIIGRLLIGMGKKLKPVQLCIYTLSHKPSKELMRSMVRNRSKARWGPVVFLMYRMKATQYCNCNVCCLALQGGMHTSYLHG